MSALTKSDVQALKDQVEADKQAAEEADFESTTSLNDFLKATTPSTAAALGMMVTVNESLVRLRYERAAMKATTTEPTPEAGAAAYTLGLLVILVPIMISTGALISPDLATAAVGGIVGSAGFNFDDPR